MSTHEPIRSRKEALAELASARDEAKVQLHLFSLEARERWQELEKVIDTLEFKIGQSSEKAAEGFVSKVREATRTAKEFLHTHSGRPAELTSPVSSIMGTDVHTCGPQDSLNRAAQILWDTNCGCAPVLGPDGALLGMLTDRDICMASYTQGRPLSAASVESAMSRQVYSCSVNDPIEHVLSLMREKQVHRVPVTTSEGRLAGIVSLADLARWVRLLPRHHAAYEALASTLIAISEQRREESRPQAAE